MSSVTYSSTRGGQKNVDFRTVVMQGLARDKGLFVPDEFPAVSAQELQDWRSLSYPDLAVQVIRKFVGEDQVPFEALNDIVHRSCAAFRHEDVTPVIQVGGHAIMVSFIYGSVQWIQLVLGCSICFVADRRKVGGRLLVKAVYF